MGNFIIIFLMKNFNFSFYLPRNDLRAGRVYYLAEPHFRNIRSKDHIFQLQKDDHEVLPYFEFSFAKHDSPCTLPEFDTKWVHSHLNIIENCKFPEAGQNLLKQTLWFVWSYPEGSILLKRLERSWEQSVQRLHPLSISQIAIATWLERWRLRTTCRWLHSLAMDKLNTSTMSMWTSCAMMVTLWSLRFIWSICKIFMR